MGDKQRDDTNRKYLNEIARRLIVCHFELEFRYMLADMRFALFAFYSARRKSTLQWFQLVAKIYGTHHSTIVCKQRLLWRISYYECERIWVEDTHTLIYGTAHITLPLICRLMYDANVFVSYLDQELCVNSTEWMSCLREISYRSMQSWEKKKLLSLGPVYFPIPSIYSTWNSNDNTIRVHNGRGISLFAIYFHFFLFVLSLRFFKYFFPWYSTCTER